jgi:hypothetical protein
MRRDNPTDILLTFKSREQVSRGTTPGNPDNTWLCAVVGKIRGLTDLLAARNISKQPVAGEHRVTTIKLQSDLLYGRAAIIAFCKELGLPWNDRQVTWRIENGVIPTGRLGRRRIGSRQAITERITSIARGEREAKGKVA